jgi:hypothetical protein
MSTRILLKNVRLAFGQGLFVKSKPPKAGPDAKEKYRVTFLLPKDHPQIPEIKKILAAEASALWGAKTASVQKAAEAQQKWALRDGNLKDEYEGFAGNWALSANSFAKPTVFDQNRLPISQDSGIVYSGCYVNAIVVLKAFDNVSKGTTCELSGVQWFADGDAFSGGKPADADEFPDEIAAPAGEDPLMG